MSNEDSSGKGFLTGVVVGSVVGAFVALMFAPKSGKELRNDLNNQTSAWKDRGGELASIALEKSSNLAKSVSDQSTQMVGKVKEFRGNMKKGRSVEGETNVSAFPTSSEVEVDSEIGSQDSSGE